MSSDSAWCEAPFSAQTAFGQRVLQAVKDALAAGEVHRIYLQRPDSNVPGEYLVKVAETKRFLERWVADDEFRTEAIADAGKAARSIGLSIDPDHIRSHWDARCSPLNNPDYAFSQLELRYRAFILEKITHRNQLRAESAPSHPRMIAWRKRQLARAASQLPIVSSDSIVHAPFCVELTHGCSVGCWFCGIGAPRLGDCFALTPENTALWRGALQVLREVYGPGIRHGFCYWANEPFDHPDYEKFLLDYHEILGAFPQTTTALALKDLGRTRALLNLSRQKGGMLERFSLLTREQVRRIHEEFSPLELLFVELITQNKESLTTKSNAGRAMENSRAHAPNEGEPPGNAVSPGTSACVTGFLMSMVKRTVKLVSPCEACVKHPLGYITFDEETFQSPGGLRRLLQQMIERNMPATVESNTLLRFRDDLSFEEAPDGFRLSTRHMRKNFTGQPGLRQTGRLLREGRRTAGELANELAATHGISPAETFHSLNLMLDSGVLEIGFDERPKAGLES
ncbi:MAG: radical SAM family RiPP maturation amino acid epimerase [Verrucomicrobiae bacterium]|nr:radical SAM family RiPP maturation amino acid epimerase [Verrucomicrobiae bacterium]